MSDDFDDIEEWQNVDIKLRNPRRALTYGRPFATTFSSEIPKLMRELTSQESVLYWELVRRMKHENHLTITRAELAEIIGTKPNHASELINKLAKVGALLIESKNPYVLIFSPQYVWKGRVAQYWQFLREPDEE